MRLAIDTNVIIDVMQRREPFYEASLGIFDLLDNREFIGALSSNALTDVHYLMRGYMTKHELWDALRELMKTLHVISVERRDCMEALDSDMDDFKDGILAFCAQKWDADYIITRDIEDFKNSPVPALTPKDFLAKIWPDRSKRNG